MPDNIVIGLMFTATAGAAVEGIKTLGSSVEALKTKSDRATRQFKEIGEAIKKSAAAGKDVSALNSQYVRLWGSIERAKLAAQRFQAAQDKLSGHRAALRGMMGDAMGIVGLGASLAAPVKQAIDFESAMADVRKVVDGTPEQIDALGKSLITMSRTLPLSARELAAIAASGGELGVALKDLPDFTTVVAKMATAFDMSASEAGDAMAGLSKVYDIPITKMGMLGDAINQLSNEGGAKASQIVNTLGRIGGTAKAFGLASEQAAALSDAFIEMKVEPEIAARAINTLLTKLQLAEKQPKKFQDALHGIGMSASGMRKAISKDANGAVLSFLKTLNTLDATARQGVLYDMFGEGFSDEIAKVAGQVQVLENAQTTLGRASGSMEKEFAARAATTANNLQLLKNNMSELGITVGSVLLPALNDTVNTIKPMVLSVVAWSKAHPDLVANIGKAAAGILAFKAGSLGLRFVYHTLGTAVWSAVLPFRALKTAMAFGDMAKQFGLVGAAVKALQGGVAAAGTAAIGEATEAAGVAAVQSTARFAGLRSMFGLLGRGAMVLGSAIAGLSWPVILVGALFVGAGLLIYKFWRPIKDFFIGFWKGLKMGMEPIGPIFRQSFQMMAPTFNAIGAVAKPVIDWFKNLIGPVQSSGEATQKFGEIVGYTIGAVVKWFAVDLPDAVLYAFGELRKLPENFKKIGMDMMNGLIGGVMGKMGEVKDTIVGAGKSVTGWFSGVLGISSPSKVFRKLGGFLDEGLALGIQGGIGRVTSAVGALSRASIPNVGDMVRKAVQTPRMPDLGGALRQALPAAPRMPNLQGMAQQALSGPLSSLPKLPNLNKLQSTMNHSMNIVNNFSTAGGAAEDIAAKVRGAAQQGFDDFRKQMARYQQEMGRRAFGGALG